MDSTFLDTIALSLADGDVVYHPVYITLQSLSISCYRHQAHTFGTHVVQRTWIFANWSRKRFKNPASPLTPATTDPPPQDPHS